MREVLDRMENKTINIRKETLLDIPGIREVNIRAFGQRMEADLVDKLRATCPEIPSLVAVREEQVVGHIIFSPVTINGANWTGGMGLAPMAVLPELQRQDIGSGLIRAGIATLRDSQCPFIVVLGHPEYYPKFGFQPASRHGLRSQWKGVPDEAFLVLVLDPEALKGHTGVVR